MTNTTAEALASHDVTGDSAYDNFGRFGSGELPDATYLDTPPFKPGDYLPGFPLGMQGGVRSTIISRGHEIRVVAEQVTDVIEYAGDLALQTA